MCKKQPDSLKAVPNELKIGFIITAVLILVLLWKRRKPKPTQLDLTGFIDDRMKSRKELGGVKKVVPEVVMSDGETDSTFDEHVFVVGGKKYNAWNVLEVPVGGSVSEIKKAYAFKTQTDVSNQNLYFKAYDVLIRK